MDASRAKALKISSSTIRSVGNFIWANASKCNSCDADNRVCKGSSAAQIVHGGSLGLIDIKSTCGSICSGNGVCPFRGCGREPRELMTPSNTKEFFYAQLYFSDARRRTGDWSAILDVGIHC